MHVYISALQPGRVKWVTFSPGHEGTCVKLKKSGFIILSNIAVTMILVTVLLESIYRFIINVLAQAIVSLQVLHNSYLCCSVDFKFKIFFIRVTSGSSSGSPGLSQWVGGSSGSPDCDPVATLIYMEIHSMHIYNCAIYFYAQLNITMHAVYRTVQHCHIMKSFSVY